MTDEVSKLVEGFKTVADGLPLMIRLTEATKNGTGVEFTVTETAQLHKFLTVVVESAQELI